MVRCPPAVFMPSNSHKPWYVPPYYARMILLAALAAFQTPCQINKTGYSITTRARSSDNEVIFITVGPSYFWEVQREGTLTPITPGVTLAICIISWPGNLPGVQRRKAYQCRHWQSPSWELHKGNSRQILVAISIRKELAAILLAMDEKELQKATDAGTFVEVNNGWFHIWFR